MMTPAVDPGRLTQLRKRRGLTQGALANKAGLSKQTIYRLERGRQSGNQQKSLEGLCRALGVDADVLSGRKSLPLSEQRMDELPDGSRYQLNVRLDGAVRNAFSLVASRYRVSVTRIVEFAPLLFFLAAEQSLSWRRRKLEEFEAILGRCDELASGAPHLARWIYSESVSYDRSEGIELEATSVSTKDIFGRRFADRDDPVYCNPLAQYLMQLMKEIDPSAVLADHEGEETPAYYICRGQVAALVGDDEEAVRAVLFGLAPLHELPDDLTKEDAEPAARGVWAREKMQESLAREAEALEELFIEAGALEAED